MKKAIQALVIILCFYQLRVDAQVVINEYVPANVSGIINGSDGANDWIELYNSGGSSVNLSGYGLTDDVTKPHAFTFPSYTLASHGYVIVFASDHDNVLPVDHWETAVTSSTTWRYFAGTSQPDTNWRNNSFNDGGWTTGAGGIGFGDGDDGTTITTTARSVMMRKTFTIADTSLILKAIFNIDYDDGFVAYLNGAEIARAYIGSVGDRPDYDDLADVSHEALMYQGQSPDSFYIDPAYLKSILRQGSNVLSVEVHNQSPTSNDLTAKPYLSFGIRTNATIFSAPPSWFGNPPREYLSAKFKLSRSGETIYLTNPGGTPIDQQSYLDMQSDNSMGRNPDGGANWCLMQTPTPGTTNNGSTCYSGYAIIPVFSITSGFYPTAQTLTLSTTTPGGVIRYTTNGNTPTASSQAYSSPINISSSVVIRARVFSTGYLPSPMLTNTYVINENVRLPVFSITTDSLNLWDWNTGIYVLGPNAQPNSPYKNANFWQDWSKPASIEYFDKNKNKLFGFDAEISIYGNYSRAKPQKSIEIELKDKYGTGEINYAFIPDKNFIDKTDNILLRNSGTDWNVAHFRDPFMERVLKTTNCGYLATEPAVMYLNGSYWGVFMIHENHDHHWIQNNYGLGKEDIDHLDEHGSTVEIKNGSDVSFWSAYNYATTQDSSSSQFYTYMDSVWDLKNLKDYFIAETYYDNGDWIGDWTNNIKLWRPNAVGGKWRHLLYDTDFGLGLEGSWTRNTLDIAIHPAATSYSSRLFNGMLRSAQFKREFINRYADLINTIFKPSAMLPIMHQFQDSMSFDMQSHFAKWGSNMTDWQSNINVMTSFINLRPARVRDQIQSEFGMAAQVSLTFDVSPAGAGRIQVSTVVPQTYPWTGVYFNGNPVTITAIPNPGYTFNHWNSNHAITNDLNQTTTYNFTNATETITAFFTGSSQPVSLTISELNYHDDSLLDADDWIELHNFGSLAVNLSNWKLKDQSDNHSFVFPVGTVIPANGYLVVAKDVVEFNMAFPSVTNVIGPLGYSLNNDGDQIRLFNSSDQLYLSFFYQDLPPWPIEADGQGFTCELSSNTANLNDGASWFPGCKGGSPGRAYTTVLSTATHISGNSTFCPAGQTVLTINNTPGYTYQWQRNQIDIPTATDTLYVANQAGSYTVRVINQGCSSISDTLVATIVSVGQAPVVTSGSRCGDGHVTISATANDSIYWFDIPGGNILGAGPTFVTPDITNTTTYYAQASLSCPSTAVPVDAVINHFASNPVVSPVNRCGPGAVTINATDTATVNWYNDPSAGALIYSGNIFVTGYIPHDTVFYAEAGSVCISERIPVNVTITSAPVPQVDSAARCGPGTVVLHAIGSSVTWYDTLVGGTQVFSGINFITPTLSSTTIYYVEANNGCASARVASAAQIFPIPAEPVSSDSTRCGPGSVELYATSSAQIFWYDVPTGGSSITFGSSFNTPFLTSTTTYYAESFDVCSSGRTIVQAIVTPGPTIFLGNDTTIASGGTITLDAGAGFDSYLWSTGDTTQTIVVNSTDNYSVSVLSAGCSGMDTITVTIVLGIQQNSAMEGSINVYPNPVKDNLTIQLDFNKTMSARIFVYDITGKTLITEDINLTPGRNSRTLDMSSLSKGIYFVAIKSEDFYKAISVSVE